MKKLSKKLPDFLKNMKIVSFIKMKVGGLLKIIPVYLHRLLMLNMYTDCYSFPVINYIDLISLNDYKKLKKTCFPVTKSCYTKASEMIREHIIEISKNEKIKALNSLNDELEYLQAKFDLLITIGIVLEQKESEICLIKLKEMGYPCTDRESALNRIKSALKNLSINIKLKIKDIEEKREKEPQKATNKAEFIAQKQILHKQGFGITDKSSTADYIISIGLMKDEVKRIENSKNKKR